MKVYLSAHGNPDHNENPHQPIYSTIVAFADSVEKCQKIVRDFIDDSGIGAGNWTGGAVFDGKEQVGYISYNSRYWPKGSKYYEEVKE
jgi:hypothetical protein